MGKSKKRKLKLKYPIIKKGKTWWKSLSYKDKDAFIQGFILNKKAEEIQKKEIELNKKRRRVGNNN